MSEDAERLTAYARSGDVESLSALVVGNSPWMVAVLRSMLPPSEVEDALQDAWLKVIRSAHRFRGEGVKSYLGAVVRSVAIDRLRKGGKTVSFDAEEGDEAGVSEIADGAPGPGERFASSASREEVYRAVRSLSEGQRQVFLLRVEAEMSFREIADELQVPLGTVLTWMRRAALNLRKMLKGEFDGQ